MLPRYNYIKITLTLSILIGLSVSLFSQEFIDRRLDEYAAKTYSNLHLVNDTILLIGRGTTFQPSLPAKINITRYTIGGEFIDEKIFIENDELDYLPWLQGSTKRDQNNIYISGSGGYLSVNDSAWVANYNIVGDSLNWFTKIKPLYLNTNNSIVTEIKLDDSNKILALMIESSGEMPQKFYLRLVKIDNEGEVESNFLIEEENFDIKGYSILKNSNNETIIGVDVSPENGPISLQLWRLDSDGNILDKYISGEEDNGQKCNKIIETADGGYIFLDRVLEKLVGQAEFRSRITKLNSNLEKEWELKLGLLQVDTELFNVKKTNDGNYIAVGGTDEEDNIGTSAHIVKFTEEGDVIWESTIPIDITADNNQNSFTRNYLYDVMELEEGGFIACGQSLGQFVDSFPQQALLIRVDDKGQLNHIFFTPPPNLEPLIVFPNPVQSTLYFKEEKEDNISYEIISLHGSLISKGIYRKGTGIDVSFLVKGMYIVRLENGRKASFVVGN